MFTILVDVYYKDRWSLNCMADNGFPREVEIVKLIGQVVGLHGVREIGRNGYKLRVSQASFLNKIGNKPKRGLMFFWNHDADRVEKLRLGAVYKFRASVMEKGSALLIFFLPSFTKFEPAKPITE